MRRILLIFVLVSVLVALSCKDPVSPDPVYFPASPEECVYYLEKAFNSRDIVMFKAILTPDFTFWFNPIDVGSDVHGYIIPASWDYDEENRAIGNMYRTAYDISMQLPENDIGTPPEGATEYTASDIGVSLVVMENEENGFIANRGTLEFTFEKTNNGGEYYWRLTDWKDYTHTGKSRSRSLGETKAYFYALDPLPE